MSVGRGEGGWATRELVGRVHMFFRAPKIISVAVYWSGAGLSRSGLGKISGPVEMFPRPGNILRFINFH